MNICNPAELDSFHYPLGVYRLPDGYSFQYSLEECSVQCSLEGHKYLNET
jgi:hypothetical protein